MHGRTLDRYLRAGQRRESHAQIPNFIAGSRRLSHFIHTQRSGLPYGVAETSSSVRNTLDGSQLVLLILDVSERT